MTIDARRDAEALLWCFPDRVLVINGVASMPWQIALERMRVMVLGAACTDRGCSELAQWLCYWPGDTRAKCTPCKESWERVAVHMGFELVSKSLDVPVGVDDTARRFSLLELN